MLGDRIALAVEPKANSQRSLAESTKGGWVREISSGQSQLDVSKKKKKKSKPAEAVGEGRQGEVHNPTQGTGISSSNRRPQPGGDLSQTL